MKNNIYIKLVLYFFISSFVYFFISPVHAADFKTSYNIEYYIQDNDPQNYTKTAYTIVITNLQPDLIIKKFTLSFPRSFAIGNIHAKDDDGTINATTVEKDRTIELTLEMSNPKPGLNEINTLYLDFLQKNIFRTKGSIWEVFIPTLENKENDLHSITVFLPPGKHKKLSLAKPPPDLVSFDKVVWNRDVGRSIYAVFGEVQRYSLDLTYHLLNPNIYKVYTDVAFPPDTLYQHVIVDSIVPPPDSVFSDADGNFMARYNLDSKQSKQIIFKGIAEIYSLPRPDYRSYIKKQFEKNQKTLFNTQPFWKLDNETPIKSTSIKEHYDYAIQMLSYNFNRIIKGNSRMGASQAVRFPDQAVCTEYSDLFIASARQRGLYVREVQGFAFANEQELRPIQQDSDILHSWAEYYDPVKGIWVPVDPTWQDTSGIDYFSSFDFNHIVFALHGKKDDYPFPAGSYKSALGGKDIKIEPTTDTRDIIKKVRATLSPLPLPDADDLFSTTLTVQNVGNVTMWDFPLGVVAENALLKSPVIRIEHLLPGEIIKIPIIFKPKTSLFYQNVIFTFSFEEKSFLQQQVQVPTILTAIRTYYVPGLFIGGGLVVLILVFRKKREE